jgi:hypothetical protein
MYARIPGFQGKTMRVVRLPVGRLALVLFLALLLAAAGSCRRETPVERVDLPPTPVLTLRSSWGVVRAPFLRLRQEPLEGGTILAHVRRGEVLEIISRTDIKETLEGQTGYWYLVSYGGLRGWVFGAFLEILDSRSRADALARELLQQAGS